MRRIAVVASVAAASLALPAVAVASAALALVVSVAVVSLAAFGVRERLLLETRPVIGPPRLRLGLLAGRALALWLMTMPAFALLESYIHWRQGLGWHGLHCLTGPVHRNAIPVLGALSLVVAAVATALEHVFAWMRRTLARLAAPARTAGLVRFSRPASADLAPAATLVGELGARGPPRLS